MTNNNIIPPVDINLIETGILVTVDDIYLEKKGI